MKTRCIHIGNSQHALGPVFNAQGKLEDTENLYRKALKIVYDLHGTSPIHPGIAGSLNNLGKRSREVRGSRGHFQKMSRNVFLDLW